MPDKHKPRVMIEDDDGSVPNRNTALGGLIGDDMLNGVGEIAMYLYARSDKKTTRRVYVEIAAGHWPHWKRGNGICASKQALADHYRKMTGGKPGR